MPRERVADFSVEYTQVLDADGAVDEELAPDVDDELLETMYRTMKRSRRLDERAVALQRRGELGTYAPATGQEAAQIGSALALRETDWMVPAFREHPAYLARGTAAHQILLYAMGMEEGAEIPAESNDLPPSIAVGSQPLHAVGIGWGQAIDGADAAALTYFGDGATSEGDLYEALNLAGVYDAHAVFLCQNNQYAISVPRSGQTRAETLAQKAIAGGIEGRQVDGNDVLGVYAATMDALESAREGDPVFLEALTYRRLMHTTSDDPTRYRTAEEEGEWEEKDPIRRFERYLKDRGLLDDDAIARIEDEIEEELAAEIDRAREREAALDPADMFRFVYADLPPGIERQREAFEREEAGAGEGVSGDAE